MGRKGKIYLLFIISCCFFIETVIGQINRAEINSKEGITELLSVGFDLLPVDVVVDSAMINSPIIKNADLNIKEQQLILKGSKFDILKSITLNGGYSYGTNTRFNSLESSSNDLSNSLVLSESATYNLGVGVRLSIYDLINRKSVIKINAIGLEKLQNDRIDFQQALKEAVVITYEDCLLKKKILGIYQSDLQSALLNLKMAKKQFENAEIGVDKITDVIDSHSKAAINLESGINELQLSLFKLHQLSGIGLNDLILTRE